MNLHEMLKPYEYNEQYYYSEGAQVLLDFLFSYGKAHPWFHWHLIPIEDSNSDNYFHYAVVYWSDGSRPTLNSFNFIDL